MKHVFLAIALTVSAFGQEAYETAPQLKAADILKPEVLAGPSHRVLDTVSTRAGHNHYIIETPWGYFAAAGDLMLLDRLADTQALAALQNVSKTQEYKEGLKEAAKTPLNVAKGLIEDPKDTVKNTAKGVWKFMNRAGDSLENVAKGHGREKGDNSAGKQMLGFSKAKRDIAIELGADPYSSNETLQQQLDQVAWVRAAGSGTLRIATAPVSGGAGIALSATSLSQSLQQSLRDLSPADLRAHNQKLLLSMGVERDEAERFLLNAAFNPTKQTSFVQALTNLQGVKNRGALLQLASDAAFNESDADFCLGTAQLLAALHTGKDKLAKIATIGRFPVALAEDGRLVVALQWDTAYWSEDAELFINRASTADLGQRGVVVAITGNVTPRVKAEFEKRKIGLLTLAFGGPQK